ncbi:heparan-alpha-glucosaminide N-acetyltransferase [Pararhizobium antarcticum]|uniref:Heparan-alpha-glucosaminide N-acetyltransferase catalytic domain-containing protein n=1 Tax=Pararhizobium antarcticum TaxID=1798805 RepID=A0A657LTG0_9HYPH|nr:DUF1624 domain-containing protein [Pararhizobium antarcticum]OJF95455.1 hypothetical protein AX761_17770 [Rhizobium sp. 58]OJF97933.1 hypothetical protein AX760_15860 [Pararhizobium antarcticum]
MSTTNASGERGAEERAASPKTRRGRILAIDTLRGFALIAMASYHFAWDLELFGYIDAGTTGAGLWKLYARIIASSFLFLAGFSLVLGHYPVLRGRSFAIRFAKIAGAALVITIATRLAFPQSFIFFGILHSIAAASLVGLLFLRLPVAITLLAAVAAFLAPDYLRSSFFDSPALWWVGLSESLPRSNDYVPLLPWLAPFLAGIAAARLAVSRQWLNRPLETRTALPKWQATLIAGGRHSLAFYLLHQPLLIGLVYVYSLGFPAAKPDPLSLRNVECTATCRQQDSEPFCTAFCGCTLNKMLEENLFTAWNAGEIDGTTDDRIARIAGQCTMDARAKDQE